MNRADPTEEAIFNVARLFPDATKLSAYLDLACEGNPDLRPRIERLLGAASGADDFFQRNSAAFKPLIAPLEACASIGGSASESLGTIIGRYKLLEKIGEGGFGIVYLAEQKEPVKRRVALKIIKLGMDTKQVVARFEAERQALALMDHPNIAKVFDGGATEAGRPYFVMELVRGVPITNYCDENRLATSERLQLFLQVCQAVQHAHQKGIIHRDLKPSNILVTVNDGVPVPKVIDFGVAKATQQALTEKTIVTQFHHFIGTPAYMSPEQAVMTSLDIDTRSDIYSLGVLLYELLTSKTPFDAKELMQSGLDEMRRTIREKEPPKPSKRLTQELASADAKNRSRRPAGEPGEVPALAGQAGETFARAGGSEAELAKAGTSYSGPRSPHEIQKLISLLRGDLDWIAMKCLEKDRNRRYQTANGLAADINHFLSNEPVMARPPSPAYRFQKLVRRHRVASMAVVLVTVALFLGVSVATWALLRERAARLREQSALEQANQHVGAANDFVKQVFYKVAPEIFKLAGAANAQETLTQAGLNFVRRLRAITSDDPELRAELARLLIQAAWAQDPGLANTVGDYAKGLQQADEAFELLRTGSSALTPNERSLWLYHSREAAVRCLWALGKREEGLARLPELEAMLDQMEKEPSAAQWARERRINLRLSTAPVLADTGRQKEAIELYLLPFLASAWARSIGDDSPESQLRTLLLANICLMDGYAMLNDFDAMLPFANEAVRLTELLVKRFPLDARLAACQPHSWSMQGYAWLRTGRVNEGLAVLAKAREEIEKLIRTDAGNDLFRYMRVIVAANQASAYAGRSQEKATMDEREKRLSQAQTYLAEAEEFDRAAKAKDQESYLEAARAEVSAARAKILADKGAQPEPGRGLER